MVLQRAVQFACGNAVVCETEEEAKRLCFDDRVVNKVCNMPHVHMACVAVLRTHNALLLHSLILCCFPQNTAHCRP